MAMMNEGEVGSGSALVSPAVPGVSPHSRADADLFRAKEILNVTLASIEDAVVTTDADGKVTSMNPAAESLTGWSDNEARGRPLHEVFQILEEDTREPASNPSEKAIVEARPVRVSNHTILVSRSGSEIPIDDSARPVYD